MRYEAMDNLMVRPMTLGTHLSGNAINRRSLTHHRR